MINFIKKNKFIAILVIIAIGVFFFSKLQNHQQPKQSVVLSVNTSKNDKIFTRDELKRYDGTNPMLPIYLALDGDVYDVTPGKEYYQVGGPYHSLAGKDSSIELHQAGGSIIKKKYKIIGKLEN